MRRDTVHDGMRNDELERLAFHCGEGKEWN